MGGKNCQILKHKLRLLDAIYWGGDLNFDEKEEIVSHNGDGQENDEIDENEENEVSDIQGVED